MVKIARNSYQGQIGDKILDSLTIRHTDLRAIQDIGELVYLGRKISQSGSTDEDINVRIGKVRQAFALLHEVELYFQLHYNVALV
uniref:Uncharacterized protein n=1 Tax=Arion vulgaris TaxID=1028688 RepID=A0A0B7AVB6_9EUPU